MFCNDRSRILLSSQHVKEPSYSKHIRSTGTVVACTNNKVGTPVRNNSGSTGICSYAARKVSHFKVANTGVHSEEIDH